MKTWLCIIFFLTTAFCHADAPAGKTYAITLTYIGEDGRTLDFTAPNLTQLNALVPLYISETRHWTAQVNCETDDKGKPLNQFNINIEDLMALFPAHGDTPPSPASIMSSTFQFESSKPVTVLKTTFYTITVTFDFAR